MMLELLAAPCLEHDGLGFLEARLRLRMVEAVALIIIDVVRRAAPSPTISRPLLMLSISASCSAMRIG